MYSISYTQYNLPFFLTRTPLVYGTWHPYKQCITLLKKTFPFVYSFFLWFTEFGGCSDHLSEAHLYAPYDFVLLPLAHKWHDTLKENLNTLKGLHSVVILIIVHCVL